MKDGFDNKGYTICNILRPLSKPPQSECRHVQMRVKLRENQGQQKQSYSNTEHSTQYLLFNYDVTLKITQGKTLVLHTQD